MAFSDAYPAFVKAMNQPSYLQQKKIERQKQLDEQLKREKTAAELAGLEQQREKRRLEIEEMKENEAFEDELDRIEDIRNSVTAYTKTGNKQFLQEAVKAAGEDQRLASIIPGLAQGDVSAQSMIDTRYNTLAKRVGRDIPEPDYRQVYDPEKQAMVWVDARKEDISGRLKEAPPKKEYGRTDYVEAELNDGSAARVKYDDPRIVKILSEEESDVLDAVGGFKNYNSKEFLDGVKSKVLDGGEKFRTLTQEEALAAGFPKGYIVQQKPDNEYKIVHRPGGETSVARERRIQSYMELYEMSEAEATKAIDTTVRLDDKGNLIKWDPVSQTGSYVEVDSGREVPLTAFPADAALATEVSDLAFDPAEGTGFAAAAIGAWNSTFGQVPFLPIGEDTEMAAQNLRVLERDAIRALGSSGRPPVVEQDRISRIIPKAMSWGENPQVAQFKMTNFVDLMMSQYVDDIRFSQDRTNPKSVREESAGRARRIESIVRRVLIPEAADAMFRSLEKIEAGRGEINSMSDQDLLGVDINNLDDAQLEAYKARLQEMAQ